MKKLFQLVAVTMLVLGLLTSCGDNTQESTFTEVNQLEGVAFEVVEGTVKSSRAEFTLTNDTEEAIDYGTGEFHFEEMVDGEWQEFVGTASAVWSEDNTDSLAAQDSISYPLSWKNLVGSVEKGGTYRMIIKVNGEPVAAEFTR